MSIAVLAQVYDEARRLAVAGSVVARGDFRLKKLLPPLDQAGAKAPIFAKVADAARAVIDGPEAQSAESLLELTSLVTAVLYTQGETGLAGTLEPIETTDLGGTTAPTSARLLKPLLEAFQRTGSGRLELVKDAHLRSAFRDLRLVKPALDALDDPYAELADFVMENVLPVYGKAILPELRAKFDMNGSKGNPRRLKLMHALDPVGSRELVKLSLDGGSKDVKVAAIACLGGEAEDLGYLIEMAAAKAEPVREAAYNVLAKSDDSAALAVLGTAIGGKDLKLATAAIRLSKNGKLASICITEIEKMRDALLKRNDKKEISATVERLIELIRSLPEREHTPCDILIRDLFAQRETLSKIKGDSLSGSDLNEVIVQRMAVGSEQLQKVLVFAHAELDSSELATALSAARRTLPVADVYEMFSPYLIVQSADKKKGKRTVDSKRDAVIYGLGGGFVHYIMDREYEYSLDPRWLDLALRIKHLGLINAIGHPGHAAVEAFLQTEFDSAMKTQKYVTQIQDIVTIMTVLRHPKATEALILAFEKAIRKSNANTYWYFQLVPELPKTAVPLLEAVVPKLNDREADPWLQAIQNLREKE